MKITIPHIHKIEGEAGFWAKVTKEGKVEELKFQTLLGLRQIEGILIGRRFQEVPDSSYCSNLKHSPVVEKKFLEDGLPVVRMLFHYIFLRNFVLI